MHERSVWGYYHVNMCLRVDRKPALQCSALLTRFIFSGKSLLERSRPRVVPRSAPLCIRRRVDSTRRNSVSAATADWIMAEEVRDIFGNSTVSRGLLPFFGLLFCVCTGGYCCGMETLVFMNWTCKLRWSLPSAREMKCSWCHVPPCSLYMKRCSVGGSSLRNNYYYIFY